jgi:hypothetical protein
MIQLKVESQKVRALLIIGYFHVLLLISEFENQFRFTSVDELPHPEHFSDKTKTYPSKNPKNPGEYRAISNIYFSKFS